MEMSDHSANKQQHEPYLLEDIFIEYVSCLLDNDSVMVCHSTYESHTGDVCFLTSMPPGPSYLMPNPHNYDNLCQFMPIDKCKSNESITSKLVDMEKASQDVAGKNFAKQTFQEIVFYLLTLNCMSFMLCKPPFSLSSLLSSTLKRLSETVKPCKEVLVCFDPKLFIAPYMYLFTISEVALRPSRTKVTRVCEFCVDSGVPQYSCNSVKSENVEGSGERDDGMRNFLTEKEGMLVEKAKIDIKIALKKNLKQNIPHVQLLDDDGKPDISGNAEGIESGEPAQKPGGCSIKKRYLDDKSVIHKAKAEILRKKCEMQKLCRNQIRLLGKKFLEKSLQQGMEIQQQLAIADRLLRSAQNMELPQVASANVIESDTTDLSTPPDQS